MTILRDFFAVKRQSYPKNLHSSEDEAKRGEVNEFRHSDKTKSLIEDVANFMDNTFILLAIYNQQMKDFGDNRLRRAVFEELKAKAKEAGFEFVSSRK